MSSLGSAGIIKAAEQAQIKLEKSFNVVKEFAYDFGPDFQDWGTTVKVPVISHGEVSAFNIDVDLTATNYKDYEMTDGSFTWVPVTLSCQPVNTFEFKGMDILEAPNAPYWDRVAEAAANGVAAYMSKAIGNTLISTATSLTATAPALTATTLTPFAKLRSQALARPADCVLALSPSLFETALGLFTANVYGSSEPVKDGYIPGAFGFKSVIELHDLPDDVKGAIIPYNALAFASRAVEVADPTPYTEIYSSTNEYGYTITWLRHGAARTGKAYINATSLFGVKLIQPNMVKLLV